MKITLTFLKKMGACDEAIDRFRKLFPRGTEITEEAVKRYWLTAGGSHDIGVVIARASTSAQWGRYWADLTAAPSSGVTALAPIMAKHLNRILTPAGIQRLFARRDW